MADLREMDEAELRARVRKLARARCTPSAPTRSPSAASSSSTGSPGCTSPRATAGSGSAAEAAARSCTTRSRSTRRSCTAIRRRSMIGIGMGAPDRAHLRERGAEEAPPAAHLLGRGDLVPDVQRALRGLRRRRPLLARRARRRRLGRERPEGVDDGRAPLELGHADRAHEPGRPEARRPLLLHPRHEEPGRRRSARSTRSPARPSSTRCSSTTCASRTRYMLGKEGQGWRVAITTLMNERVAIGGGVSKRKGGGSRGGWSSSGRTASRARSRRRRRRCCATA